MFTLTAGCATGAIAQTAPTSGFDAAPQGNASTPAGDVPMEVPSADRAAGPTSGVARQQSGEIVVTARRRAESLQSVPVSITALGTEQLQNSTVQSLNDLTSLAPGLRFSSEGGGGVSSLSLRGLSKTPVGETLPAVVIYFAEVALPNQGVDVPTYDLENIQVLKGPQGTLFGRNTLGGAVLMTPRAPGYEFGGYFKGTVGDLDLWALEGAINAPIVEDRLALRVAGQIRRRDGSINNLSGGKDFNNIRQESVRGSLLFEPTYGISNTTIVDYFHADEIPSHAIAFRDQSAQFLPLLGPGYVNAISDAVARQNAIGPFATFQAIDDFYTRRESIGVVNTTRVDLSDEIYIKNIFGWRRSELQLTNPSDGFPPLTPEGGGPTLDLLTGGLFSKRELLSNKLQLQGTTFGGALDFIVGGIYVEDKPVGSPNGNYGSRFQIGGTPPPSTLAPALSSFIRSKSYAVFGQIGLDLSEWLVEGLKINAGYRHSWDDVRACGTSSPGGFVDQDECERIADLGLVDGTGIISAEGDEPTYTIGLDYQISNDVLAYVVHRRGYRGVNVNSPFFESPFLAGGPLGTGCTLPSGPIPCPDLRAFQTTGPEKLTDVEIGVKTTWYIGDVRGRFNVAAYQSKLKDLVQFLNTGDLGVPAIAPDRPQSGAMGVNLADQTVRGVELDTAIMPVDGLSISYAGAYVDHEIDEVNFPSIGSFNFDESTINEPTPKWSGTASINYERPVGSAGTEILLHADFYHSSSYRPQSGVALPGYELLNTRIGLRNINGANIDLGFWIKNLLNEEYLAVRS